MEKYSAVSQWLKIRNISFSKEDIRIIRSYTKYRIYPAYQQLMLQEESTTTLYFLNKGIVRLNRVYDGQDYTLGIISGNDFLSTTLYILSGEPSPCALESLTEIEVLEWTKADLLAIKERLPHIYPLELAIMERVFAWVQLNQIEMICLSAEERYKKLIELQPEVVLQLPLKHVASYLGIHSDSLSRIRKKYI